MRACNNLPQPNPYILLYILVFGGCGRLLHALTPPRSAFLYLQILARCHPYILQVKNKVGCRDDTVPKTVETRRHCEEDCCMLSILLAVPSCFNSFWHGVIPTSYFIFNDFYTCSTHFFSHKYGQHTLGSLAIVHECRS